MTKDSLTSLPAQDKAGTQQIYDALADLIQGLRREADDASGRFTFWAVTAVINLLCRLAMSGTNMTKEQLLTTVDEIFTGYQEGKAKRRFIN